MKKTLTLMAMALLMCLPSTAQFGHPGVQNAFYVYYGNGYGVKDKETKTKIKELVEFARKCCWGTTKQKDFDKVKAAYDDVSKKYASDQALIECAYGNYMMRCAAELASHEEAYRKVSEWMDKIPADDKLRGTRGYYHALLAHWNINGDGTAQDLNKAFAEYEAAAALDTVYAHALASCYYLGVGTEVNDDKAYRFYADVFEHAVRQNRAGYDAYERLVAIILNKQSTLGADVIDSYRQGLRNQALNGDFAKSKELLERAADAGLPAAMYEMAMLYETNAELNAKGIGGMDKKEAKEAHQAWLQKAISANYTPAEFMRGQDILLKVNTAMLKPQVNKFFADAYAVFEPLANQEYGPAIMRVAEYDRNGWPKKSNLLGDIAKAAVSVAGAAGAAKSGGLKGLSNWSSRQGSEKVVTDEAAAKARVDAFLQSLQKDAAAE